MKALLGKKLRMTRMYDDAGNVIPLTLIEAGPCEVAHVTSEEKEGYKAVQLAFGTRMIKRGSEGKKEESPRVLREVRLSEDDALEAGQNLSVEQFEVGDTVKVTSTVKGRGYTGVVKRWGFAGAPKTHGHKHDLRSGGSIGAGFPQHVMKGMKMAGRSGGNQKTIRGLEVVVVDPKENLLGVKGSIPGAPGTVVMIQEMA